MLRFFIIALLSSMAIIVQGQSVKIDSLRLVLKTAKADSSRILIYGKLSQEYIKIGDSANAFSNAYHAMKLAEDNANNYYRAVAYSNVGYSHLKLLKLDSVKYYYTKTLNLLQADTSFQAKEMRVIGNNNIAYAYSLDGNMKKALSLIISNLPIIRELGDMAKYKAAVHNISAIFVSSGEFKKAYPYMKEDVALADSSISSDESKIETYISAALLYYEMDSLKQAGSLLEKSDIYLQKIGTHNLRGRYYAINARYLSKLGRNAESRKSLSKAWKEVKNLQNATNLYDFYVAKVAVEWKAGNLADARSAAYELYKLDRETPDFALLTTLKDLAELSIQMEDFKAASQYLQEYVRINDSIQHQQSIMAMNELEIQYQTFEKEKEIMRLKAEKTATTLAQRNQYLLNWLFGIIALVFLLAFILAVYIYHTRQKQERYKMQELQRQKELDLTQAMLTGEEKERQRIARDLHDGLGGTLSGIKIKLFSERKDIQAPIIDETILRLEHSIGELRRIARNMMPETLLRSGLEAALRDLCYSLSSDSIFIEFQSNGIQAAVPVQYQVNIYRIVQELLANALRHGQAPKIIVQCIQEKNTFLITVEDNGKGFDPKDESIRKGIGLENVRNRILLMDGAIQIDSARNEGTTVNIELYV